MATVPRSLAHCIRTLDNTLAQCSEAGFTYLSKEKTDRLIRNNVEALNEYVTSMGMFLYYNESHYIFSKTPVVRRKPRV